MTVYNQSVTCTSNEPGGPSLAVGLPFPSDPLRTPTGSYLAGSALFYFPRITRFFPRITQILAQIARITHRLKSVQLPAEASVTGA